MLLDKKGLSVIDLKCRQESPTAKYQTVRGRLAFFVPFGQRRRLYEKNIYFHKETIDRISLLVIASNIGNHLWHYDSDLWRAA